MPRLCKKIVFFPSGRVWTSTTGVNLEHGVPTGKLTLGCTSQEPTLVYMGQAYITWWRSWYASCITSRRQGAPRAGAPPEGSWICFRHVRKCTQYARLIRSSSQEQRKWHRQNLLHKTSWMSARRSTLRYLRNVEIRWFCPCHRNFRSSLQQLAAISHIQQEELCYWPAIFNGIIAAKTETSCSFVPMLDTDALQGHRRKYRPLHKERMSNLFVRSTLCFRYDKDSPIKISMLATESLLRAENLMATIYIHGILFWGENPRSNTVVCIIIRLFHVDVLLHSTAAACDSTDENH